ncbi:hypothetical protein VNI00_000636 [Paramarasmius palmivorus]|uniref:Major facilitator superfamily (MFS) profile domain-containing protein n=1 Tax=Paramarasmius palmivorus TaxID=297713 RepID=A0AAW0E6I9_9AGAR
MTRVSEEKPPLPHATGPGGSMTSTLNEERPPVKESVAQEKEVLDDWEVNSANPRNWSLSKKWTTASVVSLYTFASPLASSMMAPGLPDVAVRYGITSPTVVALTLCIFLLSFGIGPLLLAPLSEIYGRTWVLHIGNILSIAFSFGCAFAPNTGSLLALRFLAVGSGSISDLFAPHERASAMAIYTLGPLIGPVVGPVAGGFIAQSLGIKYVFIIIGALCTVASLIGIPLLQETYAPVVRARFSKHGDIEKSQVAESNSETDPWTYMWINLTRPVILLFRSYVCFLLSLYMAFMYGIYYLMFTTFADLFSGVYGFKPGVGGLVYLGLGVGFFVSTLFGAKTANTIYNHLAQKNGGVGTPEMRIPALFFGSLFVPVGLFWYGWSAQARIHWIMPIVGSGIFGFGMMASFLPIQLYLVDAFKYAASASAAASVFRSLLGFAFPLFGKQMFNALGLGGGNSLLAGLVIALGIPFPIWLYYRGAAIRARSNLTR